MEIRWLQAFVTVAEELHFGRAADRLHMAQSPLSQTIRKLEKDVGVALFERNTRSVALTAAGHALLPHAYRVLDGVEDARHAIRASEGGVYGHLRIGFTGVLNHQGLPPLTRALRQRFPDIELVLIGRTMTQNAVAQIDNGAMDLAFVGLPVDTSVVNARLIRREPYAAVLPSDHPLAGRVRIDLKELADDDFVSTPADAGSSLQEIAFQACVDAGFRPRIVQEITDPYMMLMLVAAGVGVALMPETMAGLTPPGAVVVQLAGDPVFMNHALAWPLGTPSAALAAALQVAEDVMPTPS